MIKNEIEVIFQNIQEMRGLYIYMVVALVLNQFLPEYSLINIITIIIASLLAINITITITSQLDLKDTLNQRLFGIKVIKLWHSYILSFVSLILLIFNFSY